MMPIRMPLTYCGVDPGRLRAQFPVLETLAYLNAGTDGPVPTAAAAASRAEVDAQLREGRTYAHFKRRSALQDDLRAAYADLIGARPTDVALATSTSEGLGRVLAGMDLGPGDEILTSDAEHPGLLGPLQAARTRGVAIRTAPLARIADAVDARTSVVACSHVGWLRGDLAPAALAELDVPVVLDGAQGAGAIPVDVGTLGCAAYAAAGQKWLCGADGTGFLYVAPEWQERIAAHAPCYTALADPAAGIDSPLKPDARRHDTPALPREAVAFSLGAFGVFADVGWETVLRAGPERAAAFAAALADAGRVVAPRGDTTLVAWEDPDPPATRTRLAEAGVVVRDLPNTSLLRASVGAWNGDGDLERLLAGL
jgi:selenocysteine lyase/cysteine desulfurase